MRKTEDKPINEIRRKDRAKGDDWSKNFLKTAPFAAIATLHNGQPFINHNIFYYDEEKNCIYFHTAKEGRMRFNIDDNAAVCLSAGEMGRLLPADVALEFSVEYKSVVVFGKAEIIDDEELAGSALKKLMNKYFPRHEPGKDYREIMPEEIKRTSVYKISIEYLSGKEKKADENFPGAFLYNTIV